jgi:uncharacterized protein (TIGR02646 family)
VLTNRAKEWQQKLVAAKTAREKERACNKYKHPLIKATLAGMFAGKCAYCESKITHIEYGNIEHYRPKSGPVGRPDLTFAWANMLLACGICNGAQYKGSHFPGIKENGPIINPCKDDPIKHFVFHFDAVAKLASVYAVTSRGHTTENLLGLNRHELREYRSKFVQKLLVLATIAAHNPEAASLIKDAKEGSSPYAAFSRALL